LAGPSRLYGARSRTRDRTGDNRCPLDAEEGNVVSMRKAHALFLETPKKRAPRSRTRPSLGPETRARHALALTGRGAAFSISRSGKPAKSRRNRHRGRKGRTERGSPRVTASPREKVVRDASEKEGGHGLRPCEETRAPVGVRTSWQLQKSAGRVLAPNKLARSAPKRVAVRVNGGLGEGASGTKVPVTSSANGPLVCRASSLPGCGIGEGPAKTQDDVRASFSGRLPRSKGEDMRRSRDRGCKGHRILRRVLARWKAPRVVTSHLLSRGDGHGNLGGFLTLGACGSREHARVGARRCPAFLALEGEATEVSEAEVAVGAMGRKLPCSDPRLESEEKRQGSACPFSAIRRSVHGCRETPGSLVSRAEPKTPWGVYTVKAVE